MTLVLEHSGHVKAILIYITPNVKAIFKIKILLTPWFCSRMKSVNTNLKVKTTVLGNIPSENLNITNVPNIKF